ncbi:MAG: ABC transporter substrate-binding protein [Caldilinea sp.]|jgi:multiple sugar transport system substrate-binding protein
MSETISSQPFSRRSLLKGMAALSAAAVAANALAACAPAGAPAAAPAAEGASPLQGTVGDEMRGKSLELSLAVIAGWPPSQLPIEMFPSFAAAVKEKYGYDVTVRKTEAPFAALFQRVAPTLAAKSQEFNLIVSDSQWLGALAEPGWIIKADDVYAVNPELDLEPFSSLVVNTYQVYPDGSGQRWGFPQMPDTQGLFIRKDLVEDPAEQAAFEAKYGTKLPSTYDEFAELTIQEYEPIFEFFNRPDQEFYGTAAQYSKEYDFFSCAYHPYVYATGGDIWDPATGNVVGMLNTDANAAQLEYFRSLTQYMPPGYSDFTIGSMIDLFTQGKVFSAFNWLAVGLFMISPELEGKVMAVPHPKFIFPDGEKKVIGAMGGQPWVINAFNDDDHMRVCIDFLKWWYQDDTQEEFVSKGGLPWSKKGVEAEGFEESKPYTRAFKYMLEEGRSRDFWHLPEYAELLAVQQEAYSAFASGQVNDPKRVLDYIAGRQQQILFDKGRTQTAPPAELLDLTLS